MALHDRTPQQPLTPEKRRAMLCAFADRMLVKVTSMDDPDDMPGIERAVRVAAVIERIYSRCDRAEAQAPDPKKREAEHALHTEAAIKARVQLADTLKWGEQRQQALGKWWEAAAPAALAQAEAPAPQPAKTPAQTVTQSPVQAVAPAPVLLQPAQPAAVAPKGPRVEYVDYTDAILRARAEMGLPLRRELPGPAVHQNPEGQRQETKSPPGDDPGDAQSCGHKHKGVDCRHDTFASP